VRILLVDDETDVRLIAGISLSRLGGMEVIEAASGQEALRLAPTLRPDAIVLDVQMPGLTGVETLQAIRKMPEIGNTTVIFLTAHSSPADIEALLASGANAVLVKPFEPGVLAEQVRAVVEGAMNVPPS
jgi:two-component system, OmpR family, response regulator